MNAVIVDTSPQVLRPTQDSRSVLFHNAKFAEAPLFSEFLMAVCIAEPDVRNKIELLDIMRSIYSGSMPRAIDYCTPKFREVLRACGRADINCTFEAIKDCVQSLLETVNGHPVSRTLFDDSELRSYLTFSYRQAVAFLSLGVNVSSIYCLKSQMQSMTCLLGRSRYLADALIKDGLLADTLHCLCAHLRLVSLVEDATSMPPFSEILSSFLSCFGLELVEMMPNQTLLNPGPTALLGGKE